MKRPAACGLLALALCACATDQLRNTKTLATREHVSLYENGAFRVPHTDIALIPAGPDAWDLAMMLMKVRARQSLETSFKRAAESVYIVSEGTRLSFQAAKTLSRAGQDAADAVRRAARPGATLLILRSSEAGKAIAGKAWEFPRIAREATSDAGKAAVETGRAVREGAAEQGLALARSSLEASNGLAKAGARGTRSGLSKAVDAFVLGYVAVPSRMRAREAEGLKAFKDADFSKALESAREVRTAASKNVVDLVSGTVGSYGRNVASSFHHAADELSDYRSTGVPFASLRALRWVLQGALGDAVIVPTAKLTGAAAGYLAVNMVAYPCLVLGAEGKTSALLAAEVTWDASKAAYQLTAPTGEAAVAAVFGVLKGAALGASAAGTAAGGTAAGFGEAALGRAAGVLITAGGAAGGAAVRYIGVPLASAGLAVGSGTVGAAVAGTGFATGAALKVGGETAAAASVGFGNVIAGATVIGGGAASVGVAGAYDVYELSKAVIVPPGYVLAGAVVLDYDTLSQLSAQSILAASDCAYMVLSLEGPRWALYAVQGKTHSGDDVPVGAVVDLKKMRDAGEEIYNIPVTDAEMRRVVESVYGHLPETPPPQP